VPRGYIETLRITKRTLRHKEHLTNYEIRILHPVGHRHTRPTQILIAIPPVLRRQFRRAIYDKLYGSVRRVNLKVWPFTPPDRVLGAAIAGASRQLVLRVGTARRSSH
jgi:hypothetical protein